MSLSMAYEHDAAAVQTGVCTLLSLLLQIVGAAEIKNDNMANNENAYTDTVGSGGIFSLLYTLKDATVSKTSHYYNTASSSFRIYTLLLTFFATFLVFMLFDILSYLCRKKSYPGPNFPVPFIGQVFQMINNPIKFWDQQSNYNRNGISVNSFLGRFMVFVTNKELCKKVFCSVFDYRIYAHPNGYYLFGKNNLCYLAPTSHKETRSLFHYALYGQQPLEQYYEVQENRIRKYAKMFSEEKANESLDIRLNLQVMTADSSIESFLGKACVSDEELQQRSSDILVFTQGFLAFPIPLPGFFLYKSLQAKKRIEMHVRQRIQEARAYITKELEAGKDKSEIKCTCVVEYWVLECVTRSPPPKYGTSEGEITDALIDMLYASQDAATASMAWALHELERNPDIKQKVAEEVAEACKKHNVSIEKEGSLFAIRDDIQLARSVALEVLRVHPPVPMVPYVATRTVKVNDNLVLPSGSLIIPSIQDVAQNVRTQEENSNAFDPSVKHDAFFEDHLVFGVGQHKCPGRAYAIQYLTAFVAYFSACLNFKRTNYHDNRSIMYNPTVFPDDNMFYFSKK